MTDEATKPTTLGEAIGRKYEHRSKGPDRVAVDWGRRMARDEQMEALTRLRAADPAEYARMVGSGTGHAVYTTVRKAAAESFAWDSALELALDQRTAGAEFTGEMNKVIDTYADWRDNADEHGTLEAARQRAERGASR